MRVIKGRHCTTFSLRGFQFDLSSSPLMIQASLHVQWVDLQEEDTTSSVRNPLTVLTCELKKTNGSKKTPKKLLSYVPVVKWIWWEKWMNPTPSICQISTFPAHWSEYIDALFAHSCISNEPPILHLTWSTEDVGQNCRSSTLHST